ncbi:hypothetical protein QR680_005697 [Steinernema hermaphroditum]|uniref:Uncharacterized protein n=1 Tax=Steinernema hermaphroditum TaxID=289476 RepID=A0AA39LW61_9BILA|nr:hypothetical protein QR680_005697 [Steinernema hermaphroditum]
MRAPLLLLLLFGFFAASAALPNKVPYSKCLEVVEFLYDPQAKSSEHFVKVLEVAAAGEAFNRDEKIVLHDAIAHFRQKVFESDFKKNANIFRRHDQIRAEIEQLKKIAGFLFPRIENVILLEGSDELLYHLKTLTSLCDIYR